MWEHYDFVLDLDSNDPSPHSEDVVQICRYLTLKTNRKIPVPNGLASKLLLDKHKQRIIEIRA